MNVPNGDVKAILIEFGGRYRGANGWQWEAQDRGTRGTELEHRAWAGWQQEAVNLANKLEDAARTLRKSVEIDDVE